LISSKKSFYDLFRKKVIMNIYYLIVGIGFVMVSIAHFLSIKKKDVEFISGINIQVMNQQSEILKF